MNITKTSKTLSFALRHRPEALGLTLDSAGWASVDAVIENLSITREHLMQVVREDSKQRYSLNEDGSMIRANQGHSVTGVDLGIKASVPPTVLYHGTVDKFLEVIQKKGLLKMNRHHVHLSATRDTAVSVGSRRGKPIILSINAKDMLRDGFVFLKSANGVWLTDHVPAKYLSVD